MWWTKRWITSGLPLDIAPVCPQKPVLAVVSVAPSGAQKNLAAVGPTHYAWC
jgi:hypothetical protein